MADDTTPMGGNLPEDSTGRAEALLNRNCWAIDTLVAEVTTQFETEVATGQPNWVNANLLVTFTPAEKDAEDLFALLSVVCEGDERVEHVINSEGMTTVKMWENPILMDTRDPFGIADASLGLDRELTPDDMTDLVADLAAGGEGFIEGGSY